MANIGNRVMAFQISEELIQRIKRYLEQNSKYLGSKYTQREIAKLLGISRSYVSRIEKSAIEKLRGYF